MVLQTWKFCELAGLKCLAITFQHIERADKFGIANLIYAFYLILSIHTKSVHRSTCFQTKSDIEIYSLITHTTSGGRRYVTGNFKKTPYIVPCISKSAMSHLFIFLSTVFVRLDTRTLSL